MKGGGLGGPMKRAGKQKNRKLDSIEIDDSVLNAHTMGCKSLH